MGSIQLDKSIIPALDVDLKLTTKIVKATKDIDQIGAYKIGFKLALEEGLPKVVKTIRRHTRKPLIYDHQKAANDTPHTGKIFAGVCKDAGLDYVILFPHTGPKTQEEWTKRALGEGLNVIVGLEMSHDQYLHRDKGYLHDDTPRRILELAANQGITDFVIPGNKSQNLSLYRGMARAFKIEPTFYCPGVGKQGGTISGLTRILDKVHPIIGRDIYNHKNIKKQAKRLCSFL